MPVQPFVDVSSADVEKKIAALAKKSGTSISFICNDQMRLFVNDGIKSTPPKTYAQGRGAIADDLASLFMPMDSKFRQDWDVNIKSGIVGPIANMRVFKTAAGAVYGVDRALYKPNASNTEMRRHHLKYKTKSGRVTRARRYTRDIGRWKFVDLMHVKPSKLKQYVRSQQKKVGLTKAGWGNAALYYAKKTNGTTPAYSSWVRKHIPKGGYYGRLDLFGNGSIVAYNDLPWIGQKLTPRMQHVMTMRRQSDITRQGQKRINDLAQRFNAGAL